jgi:hypothetical protein
VLAYRPSRGKFDGGIRTGERRVNVSGAGMRRVEMARAGAFQLLDAGTL